ncbi:CGNR zinc finger domain-containing protein [Paucibacter sp. M5-1]|uniref:CGNR zinc finger domain-containing protein n=1 Tax=Paucibacter sp. M5-1 TaxID=3015998 RepID=UPI0022B8E34B|nr:ABATE domain-containing protein [Paucibacter sp. M5-1]MCZ7880479.1 CGNR zinc finger domain-containing protein [Paucibacter sp. M5-1]
MPKSSTPLAEARFVGDNLALDFINTRYGVGAAERECFVDDASVIAWLRQAEALPDDVQVAPHDLLQLALELRENAEELVTAAKLRIATEVHVINRVLRSGAGIQELRWDAASQSYRVFSARRQCDAASLLYPVAEALVALLTDTPLDLVKACEAHDCTLLFHDVTKSHRRRWCSMAACGNRMKVAAFRERKRAE